MNVTSMNEIIERWSNNVSTPAEVIECVFGWDYDTSVYTATVSMEWELVCDQEYLTPMSQSAFMIGVGVGAFLSELVSDCIGRKKTLYISLVFHSTAFICSAFSRNISMFIVFRFFTGVFNMAIYVTLFVLLMELVGPQVIFRIFDL